MVRAPEFGLDGCDLCNNGTRNGGHHLGGDSCPPAFEVVFY